MWSCLLGQHPRAYHLAYLLARELEPVVIKNKLVKDNALELETTALYDLGEIFDIGGNRIYDGYIKNNKDFVRKGAAYRTYNLDGIQYSTEIFFKQDTLKQYYG